MTVTQKKIRCFLSADGESFTIKGGSWRDTLPIGKLDSQIAFYEKLRGRKGGAYAAHYAPTVEALRKLKGRIAENGGQA